MNISIFGLGYVGSVSLGCLAQNGHNVIGVDVNQVKIDFINQGKSPIIEADLNSIISAQHKLGRVSATDSSTDAVVATDVSFICVGTPSTLNGHLDLSTIFRVASKIGEGIKKKNSFHVVVVRSTVLPGTNEKVSQLIEESSGKKCNQEFAVVSNPEFLREGTAVKDYYHPPYTLVGTSSSRAEEVMKEVYREVKSPVIVTDIKIAEIIKYINNTFHALKITFANEVGNICKKLDIDSHRMMEIFCMDTKLNLSPYYLKPGFAYGGSCLPKDYKALKTIAHDHYLSCPVLENIGRSNEQQVRTVSEQIQKFNKEKIGILGLSFKAGTDDLRQSPIIDIIEVLLGKGFDIKIYDKSIQISQLVGANREYILNKIPFISKFIIDEPGKLTDHSEVVVVVNKEEEFREILHQLSGDTIIYDLVNIDFDGKKTHPNYFGIAW